MARTKLKRLSKLNELQNVFNIKDPDIKETLKNYFKSQDLYTLEIGCGHGDYSVELAQKYPERNFVGIDVKGARIFKGATRALELNLTNAAFIVTKAEWLNEIFELKSIEEIYIPFPDPHVRRSNQSRRLISPQLLKLYKELLSDSGCIHFKTDNQGLYGYALKSIIECNGKLIHNVEDLHTKENLTLNTGIITNYEKHYLNKGRRIKYICFRF